MDLAELEKAYNEKTSQMIQTKQETEAVNTTHALLESAHHDHEQVHTAVDSTQKTLSNAEKDLQEALAKQKVVLSLFVLFGATMLVYVAFRGSEYVHVYALVVLGLGVLYIFETSAFRLSIDKIMALPGNVIRAL